MRHSLQEHQPATSKPAAQRGVSPRGGIASAQLACSTRQATQLRQLGELGVAPVKHDQPGESFGPPAQLIRIRRSSTGKYKPVGQKPPAEDDLETDTMSADDIRLLLNESLAGDVKDALLLRLLTLNGEGRQTLQSKDAAISRLDSDNKDLRKRIGKATDYLKEDGEALSKGALFREHVIPLTTGALSLVNGPVNAFLNTATRVDTSLATTGVAAGLQIANDAALIWSAQNQWRRVYLFTAMVLQAAAQMLMTIPGTDDPLFQAPAQNDTLAPNSTAPNTTIAATGSYNGNKWVFLSLALTLGLLATFFRILDSRQSNSLRKKESKRRVGKVNPQASRDSDGDPDGGSNLREII
ncbi:hypothetical protein [Roseateles asaccharophilus]|uniref:Uncharacterized protein n=1 Tax=Roseateles asaccharophilus TaxID=582607 RepID=A0ABU2ADN9_9BURK|nr:hypothetical protein [Roseateles asaccharophilus]MDR7334602.1 hypothetical protein [Roseateles asaccharophilus]